MGTYKELNVWQKSIDLTEKIYKLSDCLPPSEKFGLISQMRRAAISIPSNIAEAYGRKSSKERKQFLSTAIGSSRELETQLILVRKLKLAKPEEISPADSTVVDILKMLNGLVRSIAINTQPTTQNSQSNQIDTPTSQA